MQLGQKFGKWCVVSSQAEFRGPKKYRYIQVRCEHTLRWVSYDNLVSGKSSGCASCRQLLRRRERRLLTSIHNSMMYRCYNPKCLEYGRYGGKGIVVEEWLKISSQFVAWAFSSGYQEGLSLDRIDNSRGYERGNLRWVTQAQQNRNKSNNVYVVWNGEKLCFQDFVRKYTYISDVYARKLYRAGCSLEELVELRPKNRGRRAQSIRLGKLRTNESVHGRIIPPETRP